MAQEHDELEDLYFVDGEFREGVDGRIPVTEGGLVPREESYLVPLPSVSSAAKSETKVKKKVQQGGGKKPEPVNKPAAVVGRVGKRPIDI